MAPNNFIIMCISITVNYEFPLTIVVSSFSTISLRFIVCIKFCLKLLYGKS